MSIKAVYFLCQLNIAINTMTMTISEFTNREIIYCVSSLVYTLTQENKLDEEQAISLWEGSISFDDAEYVINQDGSYLGQKDDLWGLYDNDDHDSPIVDYEYESKEELIQWYFEDMSWDINQHRSEVFEHWIVTSWLADKLEAKGETVVRDFYGLTIYCRPCTGQALHCDHVIQEIYNDLISQTNG